MRLLVKFSVATQCIHNGETSKLTNGRNIQDQRLQLPSVC